uniref:Uncharacterized protein n=1 Tax=Arundo donax TaxID=35708 RepID=A0A0A9QGG5_ARUDO
MSVHESLGFAKLVWRRPPQ